MYIGSQITEIARTSKRSIASLICENLAREGTIFGISTWRRFGIRYRERTRRRFGSDQCGAARLDSRGHKRLTVILEPGRSIVGNAGMLLTRVEYLKPGETRIFAIVDAAMND